MISKSLLHFYAVQQQRGLIHVTHPSGRLYSSMQVGFGDCWAGLYSRTDRQFPNSRSGAWMAQPLQLTGFCGLVYRTRSLFRYDWALRLEIILAVFGVLGYHTRVRYIKYINVAIRCGFRHSLIWKLAVLSQAFPDPIGLWNHTVNRYLADSFFFAFKMARWEVFDLSRKLRPAHFSSTTGSQSSGTQPTGSKRLSGGHD